MSIENDNQYSKKLFELEKQELDAPNGVPPAHIYQQMLAIYLLQNDLTSAKFLWKRIPSDTKTACDEIKLIWTVGQNLWKRDLPAVYVSLNREWSPLVKDIMLAVKENVHDRAIQLVGQAYTSIAVDDLGQLLGKNLKETLEVAAKLSWEYEPDCGIIKPQKINRTVTKTTPSEEQLQRLAQYVSFLEN